MLIFFCSIIFFMLCGFSTAKLNITFIETCDECCQEFKKLDKITEFKMEDASSDFKITGILYGNFWDLGSYDECLSIRSEEKEIFGKYCLGYLPLEELISKPNIKIQNTLEMVRSTKEQLEILDLLHSGNPSLTGLHFGVCVPNKCSALQVTERYQHVYFDEKLCYSEAEPTEMNTGALIALIFIGCSVMLAMISTVYDLLCEYRGQESKHLILIAFSMYTNGKNLVKISKNQNQLLCINGIKAITMLWIILGHVYYNFPISLAMNNLAAISDWVENPANMIIMSGALSVDTFFVVGGLLHVYTSMRTPKSKLSQSLKQLPMSLLHRYLRLTPALSIMVLIYATGLVSYVSDGPRWGLMDDLLLTSCKNKWWATILYVQNYDKVENLCVSQSWYLSVDMQLFIIAQLIIILLRLLPKLALSLMVLLVLVANIIMFVVGYTNEITGLGKGSVFPIQTSDYYYMTHVRYGPYVLGMLVGYYIYELKRREKPLKLSTWSLSLLWTVIFSALLASIFSGHEVLTNTDNGVIDGFFFALNRTIWSCGIALLIILCATGKGGPVNWFLSFPIFQLITKLSYSIYLIHYIVINIGNLSSRDTIAFTDMNALLQFFAYSAITILLSVVYCLIFEHPMMIISKIILGKRRSEVTVNQK
ncbi:hypothetical protein WA026_019632 [Henosepilachna vigintioctopunctata]|uniref:Nose resistant-to-fluoxetine protein N-terminal domain-containing protein n=1 Tax=Henosepilachna vigintioctopunctata TaxID=420089 RepID=A0AAW1TR72_9CUCU